MLPLDISSSRKFWAVTASQSPTYDHMKLGEREYHFAWGPTYEISDKTSYFSMACGKMPTKTDRKMLLCLGIPLRQKFGLELQEMIYFPSPLRFLLHPTYAPGSLIVRFATFIYPHLGGWKSNFWCIFCTVKGLMHGL